MEKIIFGSRGGDNGSDFFEGAIDDVRIYENALNSSQIQQIYSDESVAKTSGNVIEIQPGSISGKYYVFANDDNVFNEGDEKLTISIDSVVNAKLGNTSSGKITIKENDISPTASLTYIKGFDITEGKKDFVQVEAKLDSVTTVDVTIRLKATGDGELDDIRLSDDPNDTITSEGSSATLAAHYKFDGNVEDQSGNENDGTKLGASFVDDRFGNENSALYFDGNNNDKVDIPFEGTLRIEKDITINTWVNVGQNANDNWTRNVLNVEGNPNHHYEMVINTGNWNGENNQFRASYRGGGIGRDVGIDCIYNDCSNRPLKGTWYMLTYTLRTYNLAQMDPDGDYDGDGVKNSEDLDPDGDGMDDNRYQSITYLNGIEMENSIHSNGWGNGMPENATLVLGSSNFEGVIDDLRIYDGALDSATVVDLYARESIESIGPVSIIIPSGSIKKNIYVFAEDDDVFDEGDESMSLQIDTVIYGKKNSSSSIQMNVKDNDYKPTVSITSTGSLVTEGALDYTTIELKLDATTTRNVTALVKPSGSASQSDFYLSDEIITATIENTFSPKEPEIAAYYEFNGSAEDASGNENHGEIYNNATFTQDRFGNENGAIYFDGINDYIEIPISQSLRIQDEITMNLWINVEYSGGENYVIFAENDYYSLDINDGYGSDDNRRFAWGAKSAGFGDRKGLDCCYTSAVGINDGGSGRAFQGQWYMITYTLTAEQVDD
jgi:hypothetical protein